MAVVARIPPRLSSLLDLIRWSAAGLVVLYHVRRAVLLPGDAIERSRETLIVQGVKVAGGLGPLAVIVFFVVSGFLVGGSVLLEHRKGRFSFGRYAISRLSRLYVVLVPALALGLALDLAGTWLFPEHPAYAEVGAKVTVEAFGGALLFLQTVLTRTPGTNGPLWSLANEFWYYFIFPLALSPVLLRRAPLRALAGVAAAVAALVFIGPAMSAYGIIWVLGALARVAPVPLIRNRWMAALVGCASLPGVFLVHALLPVDGELWGFALDLLVGVCIANWLVTELHGPAEAAPLPGRGWHEHLAAFSFSTYVLHAPLLHFLCAVAGIVPHQPTAGSLLEAAVLLSLIVAYAWLVSRPTELQTVKIRDRLFDWAGLTPSRGAPT